MLGTDQIHYFHTFGFVALPRLLSPDQTAPTARRGRRRPS